MDQQAERRELYNGFGDGMALAFQIALTPAIFGVLGYFLDRRFETTPLFTIVLFSLAIIGLFISLWARYEEKMKAQDRAGRVGPPMTAPIVTRLDGAPVEQQIATDMVRRALPAIPVLLVIGALGWGLDGALSTAFAVGLVLVNFVLSAALLAWTARISLALMMGAALGGYLLRLILISGSVLLVKDQAWVALWPLGLTLVVTHLGLLLWETRYVSASLAFPGLKPKETGLR